MGNSRDLCQNAVAYLKADAASSKNSVPLAPDQLPVLLDLENGLVVSYVVDDGDRLTYIQHWHLVDAEMTPEELHKCGVENLV